MAFMEKTHGWYQDDDGTIPPDPAGDYYTKSEGDARYLRSVDDYIRYYQDCWGIWHAQFLDPNGGVIFEAPGETP